MTTNITHEESKQLEEEEKEEEVEEEALSLCDLPVNRINDEDTYTSRKPNSNKITETQEEFVFCSWNSSPFSKESEMCAADEVFFQGQILPLSLSLTTPKIPKPSVQDQFHKHSSPKPQLRVTINPTQASLGGDRVRKSSTWEFLGLGVVSAPENIRIETSNVNRNSTTNSSVEMSYDTNSSSGKRNRIFKHLVGKGSGCKSSVETVQSNVIIKSRSGGAKSIHTIESTTHAVKEKVLELKKQQKNRVKEGKKTMSRHRTVEWIKELSHSSYSDEETGCAMI